MGLPSTDYSYIGSGMLLLREYQAAAPFMEAGNCSEVNLSPQEDVKKLMDHTQPGGGTRNEVRRVTGVDINWKFHDFSAENFARGLRADVSTITAGTATAEQVVAYKGGYTPLAKIATAITSLEDIGGGTPFATPGDYELRDGQLYIPATSTIDAPVSGAVNVEVDYSYAAQKKVEALVNPNKQYEAMFVGLNEARSGKAVRVRAHKISGGVLQQMALIGDEHGVGEVNGGLMTDTTKTGNGISKYFTVEFVD